MKSNFFLYFILFLLLAVSVNAHSYISPGKYELKFVPYETHTLEFKVGGTGDYSFEAVSGLAKIEIIEEKTDGKDTILITKVTFPDDIKTPGRVKAASVQVEQTIEEGVGIGSQTRVVAPIYLTVPYEGIYLENSLKVPNINVNETLNLEVISKNLGNTDAKNVEVKVNIYDKDNLIKSIPFETKSVPAGKTISFKNSWDSTGHPKGTYEAEAIILNSGNEDKVNEKFEIGTLEVEIINVTPVLLAGGVNSFEINVKNGWNGQLTNVYGILNLEGEKFQTVSNSVNPLAIGILKGFADTRSISPGEYKSLVTVDFGSRVTEKEFMIKVIKAEEWYTGTWVIPSVIILIIINILYLFLFKRKPKDKNEKKRKK